MIFQAKKHTLVMAVINLTPDSFYEDSRVTADRAVEAALKAVEDGADILDLGAQSTAPDSREITAEEELSRLITPLQQIRKAVSVPISVDTFYSSVAGQALENGADIINDVSGKADCEMAQLAAKHNAGWVVMHTGNLNSSQEGKYENGVINDINLFFEKAINPADKNTYMYSSLRYGNFRIDENPIIQDNFDIWENQEIADSKGLKEIIQYDLLYFPSEEIDAKELKLYKEAYEKFKEYVTN